MGGSCSQPPVGPHGADNSPPRADAGVDQIVPVGTVVILDATGSADPDGDPLTYGWEPHEDNPAWLQLDDPDSSRASFTARVTGTYRFHLIVRDPGSEDAHDLVAIEVLGADRPPMAHGGIDRTVEPAALVILDGRASLDPDGGRLSYAWAVAPGSVADVELRTSLWSPRIAFATLTTPGDYLFVLTVASTVHSAADSVHITVADLPARPLTVDTHSGPMILVPAGEFAMGADRPTPSGQEAFLPGELGRYFGFETPPHAVWLDEFLIDAFEVTNAQYAIFLNNLGQFENGDDFLDWGASDLQRQAGRVVVRNRYDDHPITGANWHGAHSYCQWVQKRLPSEAEWEKSARGVDGRTYPWGRRSDTSRANYHQLNTARTAAVGSFGGGVSPYGVHDMAGNVAEWVADWYDDTYYGRAPYRNPAGPDHATYKVIRGGSWEMTSGEVRTSYREVVPPSFQARDVGFRCAQVATEMVAK